MQTSQEFTGLGMPVFMAFGWAGEEAALKYALSQLELFATEVQRGLPQSMQEELPFVGLSEELQSSYLEVILWKQNNNIKRYVKKLLSYLYREYLFSI